MGGDERRGDRIRKKKKIGEKTTCMSLHSRGEYGGLGREER